MAELDFSDLIPSSSGSAPSTSGLDFSDLVPAKPAAPAADPYAMVDEYGRTGLPSAEEMKAAKGAAATSADTLTFGLGAKAYGLGRAMRSYISPHANPADDATYSQGVAEARAPVVEFEHDHPIASMATKLGSGAVGAAGLAKAGVTTAGLVADSGLIPRILAMGAEGAGYGAADAAGHQDGGSLSERAKGIGQGAGFGAAVGGGLPVLGSLASGAYRYVAPMVTHALPDISPTASRALTSAAMVDRAGLAQLPELGDAAMNMDAGPASRALAGAVRGKGGEAGTLIENTLGDRAMGTAGRLADDTGKNLGPAASPDTFRETLGNLREKVGNPMVTEALANAPPKIDMTDVIANLSERAQKATGNEKIALLDSLNRLRQNPGAKEPPIFHSDPEMLHKVKQDIQGQTDYSPTAENLTPATSKRAANAYKSVAADLNEALSNQIPGYRDSMDYLANLHDVEKAHLAGQKDLVQSRSPEAVMWPKTQAAEMAKAASDVNTGRRIGARGYIEAGVGNSSNDLHVLNSMLGGEGDWNRVKMGNLFGEDARDAMLGAVNREKQFQTTKNSVTGGSQTQPRIEAGKAIEEAAQPVFPKNVTATGLALSAVERVLRGAYASAVKGSAEQARQQIAEALTAAGPRRAEIANALLANISRHGGMADGIRATLSSPILGAAITAPEAGGVSSKAGRQ